MRNRIRSTLLVTAALAVSLSAIGVSSAMATPKGEYAVFAQCPTSNTELSGCLVSRTESGHITMGKTEVPIVKTQTLQGGLINVEPGLKKMAAALNGETLTKTPQKVPGGLLGLVKCNEIKGDGFFEKLERGACELIFENGTTGVNATTELAAPASSVLVSLAEAELETGPALVLPIKVKLENPLLGKECYIGSNAHPIVLELTTGTSGTLTQTRRNLHKSRRRHPGDQKQHTRQRHLLGTSSHRLRRILLVPPRPDHQQQNRAPSNIRKQRSPQQHTRNRQLRTRQRKRRVSGGDDKGSR
jgi:hypothetical protein